MTAPRIAIGPRPAGFAVRAVEEGGGRVVGLEEEADGLVWVSPGHLDELRQALKATGSVRWVQLPFAGVERQVEAGLIDEEHVWTCAKGCYAKPVAEHALTLALAGLRVLHERIPARSWGQQAGRSIYGARVTILGGGGITEELLRLLAPFGVEATVVRRRGGPLPGASRTLGADQTDQAVQGAMVVFLALALTAETRGVIDARRMGLMGPQCWLVNVARGGHVDTPALVHALRTGSLGGAALDVTDPEPLPDGHPLWSAPNCIITPHTADTPEMVRGPLAERITSNVARFAAGEPMIGRVDPEAGY